MNLRDYVFARKINGKTKLFSFKQKLNSSTGGFKHFCLKGKYLTSFIRIKPTPSTASVSIVSDNCIQKGNTMIVPIGNTVYVTVENDDYLTQEFEFVAGKEDYYLDIVLDLSTEFIVKVDTTKNVSNTNDNTFIIPFTNGTYSKLSGDSVNINWGDGTNTIIENGVFTQENCSHVYSNPGSYNISITSSCDKMPPLSFNDNYSSINNNNLKLVEIKSPLVPIIGTNGELETNLPNLFGGCSNLTSVVEDIFKYNKQIKNISGCFEGCNSLLTIPEYILIYTPNIINVSYMFNNCDGIEEVPFSLLTSITTLRNCESMFNNCDNLKIIPNGLFSTNKTITNFTKCFENCKKLTINPNIFGDDYTYLSDVNGINFSNMFYREQFDGTDCGSAPEIYKLNYKELGGSINCFGGVGNEGLLNYWDILHTWGGPEKIELAMDIEPNDVNAILFDYDLFELPYYKDEGWNRVQVNTTPNDASVNVVHTHDDIDGYKQNFLIIGAGGVINDGIAYGFSNSDYLKCPVSISTCSKIEFGGKFKHTSGSGVRCIFELSKSNWSGFNIAIQDNLIRLWCSSGSIKTTHLDKEKYYWFKCVCDVNGSSLYISEDGVNYTQDIVLTTNEFSSYVDSNVYIGVRGYNKTGAFSDGFIDLNESYIKIDDGIWWEGKSAKDDVIINSITTKEYNSGTYLVNLAGGEYDIAVVGAGGGGSGCSKHSDGASGASGAAFVGKVNLNAGIYKVSVGAGGVGTPRMDWSRGGTGGSSSIGDVIIAGGGTGGALDASGGTGGTLTLNTQPLSYTVKSNGNNGAGGYGWGQTSTVASPYGSYGYGGYGGACDWQGGGTGGNGYVKISGNFKYDGSSVEKIGFWNNNGLISGVTTSKYLTLDNLFKPGSNKWELGFKIKTGLDLTTTQRIVGNKTIGKTGFVLGFGETDKKLTLWVSSNASSWNVLDAVVGSNELKANTYYNIRLGFNGLAYYTDISDDGLTWKNDISVSSTNAISVATETIIFGHSISAAPFLGEIDMRDAYIKINDEYWWNNKNNLYKFWDESYTQNFNIVGNMATIKNGVSTGYSSNNYISLPITPSTLSQADNWEVVTCFTTNSGNNGCCFMGLSGTYVPDFGRVASNKFGLAYSSTGTSYNITGADPLLGTYTVLPNTKYWVKQKFTGTEYTLDYSTNGIDYIRDITVINSTKIESTSDVIYCGYTSVRAEVYNEIDLSQSYIKINGDIIWRGEEYTTVGFWDNDGVLSGINSSNYIKTKNAIISNPSNYEYVAKIRTPSSVTHNNSILSCDSDYHGLGDVELRSDMYIHLWVSANGTGHSILNNNIGTYLLSTDTDYWLKYRFNGNFYIIELSKDNTNWFTSNCYQSTTIPFGTTNLWFGSDQTTAGAHFEGKIYLKEYHININGVRWWDCINKDTSNYAVNIKDKEFLTLQNSKVLINVSKNGYNDNTKYYTITDDTTLNISL